MKKILFLLLIATMTNIQGIMAQEKVTGNAGADGREAFQKEMIFPIGEPNSAYAKYFIGNSYLAPISKEQIPFRVQMLPGDVIHIPANVKHWHGAAADSWFAHLAFEVPGENTSNEWLEPVTDEEYGKLGK